MNVIPPLTITDAMLTSTTAIETAPAAYAGGTTYALDDTASVAGSAGLIAIYRSLQNANTGNAPASSPTWWTSIGETYQVYAGGTTYALDDYVIDATNHLIYRSLADTNVGNALSDDTKWQEIGPTNPWAMFDLLRNTKTSQPGSITAVITPGVRMNSLALVGVVGNSVDITQTNGATTTYTRTEDLNTREVASWYEYYFRAFSTKPSLVVFDIPPYSGGVLTVTVTATNGNAEIGGLAIGSYEYIGDALAEAENDVLNFSTVTRDFAGGTSEMVQRRNVPKTIQQILLPKSRVNRVRDLRDALNASPAIWAGITDSDDGFFESLLILGFYKRFSLNLKLPNHAIISLELEEI